MTRTKSPSMRTMRRDAIRAIDQMVQLTNARASAFHESKNFEDWVYADLYARNLRKARELLMEPTRQITPR